MPMIENAHRLKLFIGTVTKIPGLRLEVFAPSGVAWSAAGALPKKGVQVLKASVEDFTLKQVCLLEFQICLRRVHLREHPLKVVRRFKVLRVFNLPSSFAPCPRKLPAIPAQGSLCVLSNEQQGFRRRPAVGPLVPAGMGD
jgi:hypothetical protein